jgi:hypothetical protein
MSAAATTRTQAEISGYVRYVQKKAATMRRNRFIGKELSDAGTEGVR